MQVEFSEIAKRTLTENIEFLEKVWTNREIVIFLEDVKRITDDLENGKYSQFQNSFQKTKSVLIGKKHVRMFFRQENDSQIKILLFFDMRQDPQKYLICYNEKTSFLIFCSSYIFLLYGGKTSISCRFGRNQLQS